MKRTVIVVLVSAAIVCFVAGYACAQRNPNVAYIYPAGGIPGQSLKVTVGGQYLNDVNGAILTGGVEGKVLEYNRPLTQKEFNELAQKLKEVNSKAQKRARALRAAGRFVSLQKIVVSMAREMGITEEQLEKFRRYRLARTNPKYAIHPQVAEQVTVSLNLPADMQPGFYCLRLKTPTGLTNPVRFQVSPWPNYLESEPNDVSPGNEIDVALPVVINGQILAGDVDRFRFRAKKGQKIVAAVSARELIPYLADAVPGWFQAVVAIYDEQGNRLAYMDDFRFQPDPVLFFEVPADGTYELEIRDAIYRGRDDFVYRVTLGEIPFVTDVFPLGGKQGQKVQLQLDGWNLPRTELAFDTGALEPGIHTILLNKPRWGFNRVLFAVDTLEEKFEQEPNDDKTLAQQTALGCVINGRIDRPNDTDVFALSLRAGQRVVVEVVARRVNSPLDSLLRVVDPQGRQIAANDDFEDKSAGLITHHADSMVAFEATQSGTYYIWLADAQQHGGQQYAYRLRITPPQADFRLRVVPSSIAAFPGSVVPIDVYAVRSGGFEGDIQLDLIDPPAAIELSGGVIPKGQDHIKATLTIPREIEAGVYSLQLRGTALSGNREITRLAVPADDMMQAFIYHHLVPADDWLLCVAGNRRFSVPVRPADNLPIKLRANQVTRVKFDVGVGFRFAKLPSNLSLQLVDPPDGLSIEQVQRKAGQLEVSLKVDGEKLSPGTKGNLVFEVIAERSFTPKGSNRPRVRRVPVGYLPAVAFEVVAAGKSAS